MRLARKRWPEVGSHVCSEFLDSVLVVYKDQLAGQTPDTVHTSIPGEQSSPVSTLEEAAERAHVAVETAVLAGRIQELCASFRHR